MSEESGETTLRWSSRSGSESIRQRYEKLLESFSVVDRAELRIERDGYQAWVTAIDVSPPDQTRVAASLDRLPR